MKKYFAPLLFLVASCGQQEPASIAPPVPTQDIDAGTAAPASSVVRTVSFRNPFGDGTHPDNLMLDGDFEFTGRSGQTPWIAASANGSGIALEYDTGGHCRSGVRCAHMQAGSILLGYMATPPAGKVYIRVWAKPEAAKCSDLAITFYDSTTNQSAGTVVPTLMPDENGWCTYESVLLPLPFHSPLLYIKSKEQAATVDAVVVLPTTGTKPLLAGPPLSKTEEAFVGKLAAAMRQRSEPNRAPPMDFAKILPPGAM